MELGGHPGWIFADQRRRMVSSTLFAYYLRPCSMPLSTLAVFRKSQVGTLTIVQFSVMLGLHVGGLACLLPYPQLDHSGHRCGGCCSLQTLLLGASLHLKMTPTAICLTEEWWCSGWTLRVNHELPELKDEVAAWRPPLEHRQYPIAVSAAGAGSIKLRGGRNPRRRNGSGGCCCYRRLMTLLPGFLTLRRIGAAHHFPLRPFLLVDTGNRRRPASGYRSTLAVAAALHAGRSPLVTGERGIGLLER